MYCSAFALALKGVILVYLPPDISLAGGRVNVYWFQFSVPHEVAISRDRNTLILRVCTSIGKVFNTALASSSYELVTHALLFLSLRVSSILRV